MPVTPASSVPQALVQPLMPLQNMLNFRLKHRDPLLWIGRRKWRELLRFLAGLVCCELGGWSFRLPGLSSVHHMSDGVLLRVLQRGRTVGGRRVRGVGDPCACAAAYTTL